MQGVGWLIVGVKYVRRLIVHDLSILFEVEVGAIGVFSPFSTTDPLCELAVQLELAGWGVSYGGGHYW